MPKPSSTDGKQQFLKYTGWGFQFFVTLFIAVYAGKRVDNYFGFETHWMIMLFVFLVLFAQFYKLIKDLA